MNKVFPFPGRLPHLFFPVISMCAGCSLLEWAEWGGPGDTMALEGLAVMFLAVLAVR